MTQNSQELENQELENRQFELLCKRFGLHGLEAKVQKMESCRNYYRRWPYDGMSTRTGMEYVDLTAPEDVAEDIMAEQAVMDLLSGLTPREREVAELSAMGYKPRDIAELRGKTSSGADRWIKFSVKQKMSLAIERELV